MQAFGWYRDAGLDVCLLSPHIDQYATTPAAKVRNGVATMAIAPTETVISSHRPKDTWRLQPKLTARPSLRRVLVTHSCQWSVMTVLCCVLGVACGKVLRFAGCGRASPGGHQCYCDAGVQ